MYAWERYWYPRELPPTLSENGFLLNPESEIGGLTNGHLLTLGELSEGACIVLLGEPGSGKTIALKSAEKKIRSTIQKSGGKLIWRDLSTYSSDYYLIEDVFKTKEFSEWNDGGNSSTLSIYLDSIDEGKLRVETLSNLLIDQLHRLNAESLAKLKLRLVCRSTEWPISLENGLKELFKENLRIYYLAPLRKEDVIEASNLEGIQSDAFIKEIEENGIVHLANRPITLRFLIDEFRANNRLPSAQSELYLKACEKSCSENNLSRRESKLIGKLTTNQRLHTASILAALTTFGNKSAFWHEGGACRYDNGYIDIESLYTDGTDQNKTLDRLEVEETLTSGLFTSVDNGKITWVHKSYAEFLAGYCLYDHKADLRQVRSLLINPGDPNARIIPQLRNTAKMLAEMDATIFDNLIETNPDVLLSCDFNNVTVDQKSRLVSSLLSLSERKIIDISNIDYKLLVKLSFPDISNNLIPVIRKSKNEGVKECAIALAVACNVTPVQKILTQIIRNKDEKESLRYFSLVHALKFSEKNGKDEIKKIASKGMGEMSDEYKGLLLKALWPEEIKLKKMLCILTPPKDDIIGTYYLFFSHYFARGLQVEDLSTTIIWALRKMAIKEQREAYSDLIDSIIVRAVSLIDTPKSSSFQDELGSLIVQRLKKECCIVSHHSTIGDKFEKIIKNDDIRRRVIQSTFNRLSGRNDISRLLLFNQHTPVLREDVPWLMETLKQSPEKNARLVCARLIRYTHGYYGAPNAIELLDAIQKSPELKQVMKEQIAPVRLKSKKAMRLKDEYERYSESRLKHEVKLVEPPPGLRIEKALDSIESGDLNYWWILIRQMTLNDDSQCYGDADITDITSLPGWEKSENAIRDRIIDAAKMYIDGYESEKSWLDDSHVYLDQLGGYQALYFLYKLEPDYIRQLPDSIWERWGPIILSHPFSHNDELQVQQELINVSYAKAKDSMLDAIIQMVKRDDEKHDRVFILRKLEKCDHDLYSKLIDLANRDLLKPCSLSYLYAFLFSYCNNDVIDRLPDLINISQLEKKRDYVVALSHVSLAFAGDIAWQLIWPMIKKDEKLGSEIVQFEDNNLDWSIMTSRTISTLKEKELADLFIWLESHYPEKEDPKHSGAFLVQLRDEISDWKRNILSDLLERNTPDSVEAFQSISRSIPGNERVEIMLGIIEEKVNAIMWVPPSDKDILLMLSSDKYRLVRNGDELLAVIIESLDNTQSRLHSETPEAQYLWNVIKKDKVRLCYPKDENTLSDYLKNRLNDDLITKQIIASREVKIYRDSITDIHIDAIKKKDDEEFTRLSAIVEVKGCWNTELYSAMQKQLLDKYIEKNENKNGVYLIGWFKCDVWSDEPRKRKNGKLITINDAEQEFSEQASRLSTDKIRLKAYVLNATLVM